LAFLIVLAEVVKICSSLRDSSEDSIDLDASQDYFSNALNIHDVGVTCAVDAADHILECAGDGMTPKCEGKCRRLQHMFLVGEDQNSACGYLLCKSHFPDKPTPYRVTFTGSSRQCCLCPQGKRYDKRKGFCVTEDPHIIQQHNLAGSSPEAACRQYQLLNLVSECAETARSSERSQLHLPGIFRGQDYAYCCICPANSAYNAALKACICKQDGSADFMGPLYPDNRKCRWKSLDQQTAARAQGGTLAQKMAPAMEQINGARGSCMKHRILEETLNPQKDTTYRDAWLRAGLNEELAISITHISVKKIFASMELALEDEGITVTISQDTKFTFLLEGISGMLKGSRLPAITTEVTVGIAGKELLSRIGEFGSSASLSLTMDISKLWDAGLGVFDLIKKKLTQLTVAKAVVPIFSSIGKACREASVGAQLSFFLGGRSVYPVTVVVESKACESQKLCLQIALGAGQKAVHTPAASNGAEFKELNVSISGSRASGRFSSTISGKAALDMRVGLEHHSMEGIGEHLDRASGRYAEHLTETKVEPEVPAAESEPKGADERKCSARTRFNMKSEAVFSFHKSLLGTIKQLVTPKGSKQEPGHKQELKVPSMPGFERVKFESELFDAWKSRNGDQKGFQFQRSQEDNSEPVFSMMSVSNLALDLEGTVSLRKKADDPFRIDGMLKVRKMRLIGFQYDSCAPVTNIIKESCWTATASRANLSLASNEVHVSGHADVSGALDVCAEFKSNVKLIEAPFGKRWLLNVAAWTVWVNRFIEAKIEVLLAKALHDTFVVKQVGPKSGDASMTLTVSISEEGLTVGLDVQAAYGNLGYMQVQAASVPQVPEVPKDVQPGSAWQVLTRKTAEQFEKEFGSKGKEHLSWARERFTYDPVEWVNVGMHTSISEVVEKLNVTGGVDFKDSKASPAHFDVEMKIDLGKLLHAKANDPGMTDSGYLAAARTIARVQDLSTWKMVEVEAVLSCGYIFLSEPLREPSFQLTADQSPRYFARFDLTKSEEAQRRDDASSSVMEQGICPRGDHHLVGKMVKPESRVEHLCIPKDSMMWAAIRFELLKRDQMDQLILQRGYQSSASWMPLPAFKVGPFTWQHADKSSNVDALCKEHVADCALALQCLGVSAAKSGQCGFLNAYDLKDPRSIPHDYMRKVYQVGGPQTWGQRP